MESMRPESDEWNEYMKQREEWMKNRRKVGMTFIIHLHTIDIHIARVGGMGIHTVAEGAEAGSEE